MLNAGQQCVNGTRLKTKHWKDTGSISSTCSQDYWVSGIHLKVDIEFCTSRLTYCFSMVYSFFFQRKNTFYFISVGIISKFSVEV